MYKSLIDSKPLRLSFNRIDGFIGVDDGTKNFVLLGSEKMIQFTSGLGIL